MKRMITGISALAIVAATAVPALAQDWSELTMLEKTAQDTLMEYNIEDVDVMDLTLAQIAQMRDVANSNESGNTKQRAIEAIIEGSAQPM